MSKLADILFKPIGIVVSADKVQIIRPNGDKISCAKECYFFLGDKIVNNSNEDVEVTINGEKVKLEPKESTTVVSIDQKTIDNIALLQKELIKGKSIDELEESAAGKELIESVGRISNIVFVQGGHYSNIFASNEDADFIENIKEAEIADSKYPNIIQKVSELYTPNIIEPHNSIPNISYHGGTPNNGGGEGHTPNPSNPQVTPPNIPQFNTGGMRITFPEDANENGTLALAENLAPKATTTVRVWLPDNAEEGKTISFFKWDKKPNDDSPLNTPNSFFGEDRGITSNDIDKGYMDFEAPVNSIRKNYIQAHADYGKFNVWTFEMDTIYSTENRLNVEVDQSNLANLINLTVDPINGNNIIDDSSLPNEKLQVVVKVENGDILNDGYEVEVKVNGKIYKTSKPYHSSNAYIAEVRLADLKDDPDQKVEAFLKKASYNIENSDGSTTKVNMADKTTLGDEYNTHFTRSLLIFDNYIDRGISADGVTHKLDRTLTLGDIRNQSDYTIKGEVRGIYSAGDPVIFELPNNRTVTTNLRSDGTFETTIKADDLGYPATYSPNYSGGEVSKDLNIVGKYNNHTGSYNSISRVSLDFHKTLFGLVPTFKVAEDNDAGITFKEVSNDFKYSLNTSETNKLYASPNGGKLKLELDLSQYLNDDYGYGVLGYKKTSYDGTEYVEKIPDKVKTEVAKTMEGWSYEVYLKKVPMYNDEYNDARFQPGYHYGGAVKIFDGTITNGKTHYSHDFNIKDFDPIKPQDNEMYYVFTKIIPPAGAPIVKNIVSLKNNTVYVFDSEVISHNNTLDNSRNFFSAITNTFNKGEEITLDSSLGRFNDVRNGNADTLYYTDSVSKINISGNLFNPGRIDYVPQSELRPLSKKIPDSAYLVINGKKYQGEISSDGGVIFKDILTKDFKDDPDHKYEIFTVFNAEDKFGNATVGKGQYSYNIVDEPSKTQSEINAAFTFDSSSIAVENYSDLAFNPLKRASNHFDEPDNTDKPYVGVGKIDNDITTASSVIYTLMKNKYATHFDHDTVFKIDVNIPNDMNNGLFWYDPSIKSIRKITNGEIHVKAGTNFKDIVIMQAIKDDHKSDYDSEDSNTNEYGMNLTSHIGESNMALKTKNVTITIKDADNNLIATNVSKVADNDYNVIFDNFGNIIDLSDFFPLEPINGRSIIFKNSATPNYDIYNADRLNYTKVAFDASNTEATLRSSNTNPVSFEELKLGANNISLDAAFGNFYIKKISTNLSESDLNSGIEYSFKLKRSGGAASTFSVLDKADESSYDFKGIRFLNGGNTASYTKIPLKFDVATDTHLVDMVVNGVAGKYAVLKAKTIKNLKTSDDMEFSLLRSNTAYGGEGTIFENLELKADSSGYTPTMSFKDLSDQYLKLHSIHIKNSTIEGNIANSPSLTIENSTIGSASATTNIEVIGDLTLTTGVTFGGNVNVTSPSSGDHSKNNNYLFDVEVDNNFTLTDIGRDDNVYYDERQGKDNTFTFGSHAKIGSHATFNVDHSTMTFENGSVFEGTIKSGTNTNNFVIKAGATFNGTIDMADAINNITIEDGAILGPNFHIVETNTESEDDNAKYDTLTLFNDIDFTNLDVKGLDQINIGTKARGEMINMDIVFDELNSLLGGGKNTIKFWGDNDNHLTFHNEANRTFSVAADQSAVASQPYTRYEANDTASGTKYYIDVHNDINLQIL